MPPGWLVLIAFLDYCYTRFQVYVKPALHLITTKDFYEPINILNLSQNDTLLVLA